MKKQRLLFMFFSAALLLCGSAALVSAATISLPATGQTKCYNTDGAVIPCAGTGQDGDKRMGVAWPNPRFTVSGDCVTDNLTGLIWAKNANLPNETKKWQQALDFVKSLNAGGGLCGQTDWRLPQKSELESLVHEDFDNEICGASECGSNAAWLNTQGFTKTQDDYWSSNDGVGHAWVVSMFYGRVRFKHKGNSSHVWPVRAGR